jgi:hypothetical protein
LITVAGTAVAAAAAVAVVVVVAAAAMCVCPVLALTSVCGTSPTQHLMLYIITHLLFGDKRT